MCVFDCESVPDVALLREVYGFEGDDCAVCEAAFTDSLAKTGSEFLALPFHKIVSISALYCDENLQFLRIGNFGQNAPNRDEHEILAEFLEHFNRKNPRLVSFNGRAFDMPLICLRAMRHNLAMSAYFEVDNAKLRKNKWANYRARYSEDFHCDLFEGLGHFGAVRGGLRLDLVCKMLNLPGKFETHGSDVWRLYLGGEIAKIDEYCQSDVLNTYWLFLKYQVLQGHLSAESYAAALESLGEKMPADRSYSEVFKTAIERELAAILERGK